MNLREKLLANKPQLQTLDINGTTYYLRSMTVGDVNKQAFEFRNWLIQQAEIAGVKLPSNDEDHFDEVLEHFGARFRLPQAIASRLCDKEGKLLFDPQNIDDLNAIAELDNQVFIEFNKAIAPPKELASEESSN